MSSFIPINRFRSRCTICNNEVSKVLEHRHTQYHVLGDMALSKTETACPLCLTPISIKVHNYVSHLTGFHKLSKAEALEMNKNAKFEADHRNVEMPKPTYIPPPKNVVAPQPVKVPEIVEEAKVQAPDLLPKGRPRIIPNLPGETEIERERRLNRKHVQKFRAKIRAERNLPPPKKYNREIIEGESKEEREKRLNRERVRKFREARKAQKQQ